MYLLVAYKESSVDYCRGCRMASYPDAHAVHNHLTLDQLVNTWSDYLYANKMLHCNEVGFVFWVFKNGIMVFQENNFYWDGANQYDFSDEPSENSYWKNVDELEKQEKIDFSELSDLYERAKLLAEEKWQKEQEKERQRKQNEKQQSEEKAKEERRKQFEKLQQEFK